MSPQSRLSETLEELHRQLESADTVGSELRAPLQELLEDIQDALERSGGTDGDEGGEGEGLVERLERSALDFETDHPTIAGAINRLTHALSSMGI